MPDQHAPGRQERASRREGRLWRLWTSEPKLLSGIGALLAGIAAVAGLFLGVQHDGRAPAPTTAPGGSPPTGSGGGETTTSGPAAPPAGSFRRVAGPGDANYEFSLPNPAGADLDSLQEVSSLAAGVDIANGLLAPNTFDVYNTAGTQKMYRLTGPPTRRSCERLTDDAAAAYVTNVFLADLHQGDQFCLRTDGRHLAHLLVGAVHRGAGNDVDIDFKAALWNA